MYKFRANTFNNFVMG